VKVRLVRFCFFGSDSMDTLYLLRKASTKPDQAQCLEVPTLVTGCEDGGSHLQTCSPIPSGQRDC